MVQETKSEFQDKISAQLLEIEEKISDINSAMRERGLEGRPVSAEELAGLKDRLAEARAKLNDISNSSEHVWQDLRFDLEEVVYELNQAVDEALGLSR